MKRFFQNPMAIILIIIMAYYSLDSGILDDPGAWLWSKVLIIPGILIGLTVHEFAHAFVAYKLGDNTPKYQKRVTLNPIRHVDPIGLIALFFIGFGWGKPVEVNSLNFKNTRRDNFLTDIAGIVTNIIIAFIFTGVIKVLLEYNMSMFATETGYTILYILIYVVQINLVLAIFNLLPVPPLDGFGIVTEIFDLRRYSWYYKLYNFGFPILMVLIILGITDRVLFPALNFMMNFMFGIFNMPFTF